MMQLLEILCYWLDPLDLVYIYFHPLIGSYVALIVIVTKLVAS